MKLSQIKLEFLDGNPNRWELLILTIVVLIWLSTATWTQHIVSQRQQKQILIFKTDVSELRSEQKALKQSTETDSKAILNNQTEIMKQIISLRQDVRVLHKLK